MIVPLFTDIRRKWTPAKLGPNLAGWYVASPQYCFTDADGLVAAGDSDPVQMWRDRSGNARHLAQLTSDARPTLRLVSGRWFVRFDGTDDYFDIANPLTVGTGSFSAFGAIKRTASGPVLGGTANGAWEWRGADGLEKQFQASLGSSTSSTGDSVLRTMGIVWDGSARTTAFYKDGAANGTAGPFGEQDFTGANSRFGHVGSDHGFLNGDVGEFVAVAAAVSAPTVGQISRYLRSRWGT